MSRTITTNYTHGLTLTNAAYNPLSIVTGVSVTNQNGSALQSSLSVYWSITNSGFIQTSGTAAGSAVALAAGAAFTNASGGQISGYSFGVSIGGAGSVVNRARISAQQATGAGFSYNSTLHSFTALSAGLFIAGGGVTNNSGAAIYGAFEGVVLGKTGSVVNAGSIGGTNTTQGFGVVLSAGGVAQNGTSGSITGGYYGVRITGATGSVTNQGVIQGIAPVPSGSANYEQPFPFSGVLLAQGGTVRNNAGATISGGSYGVQVAAAYGAVINAGVISSPRRFGGAGVDLKGGGAAINNVGGTISGEWIGVQIGQATTSSGGTFVNYGTVFASDGTNGAAVWIHGPGEIVNQAGATIAGGPLNGIANGPYGIVAYYQTTILNFGSIGGTQFSVDAAGTSAVGNLVEMAPTASFGATVMGAKSSSLASLGTLGLLAGSSAGTVSGFGSKYQNFGTIALSNGAIWSVAGTIAAGTNVAFSPGGSGSLTLTNPSAMSGTITGFGTGDALALAGVTDATGVTLGSGNVLTIAGTGLTLQFDPVQSFTGETFASTTSGSATTITVSGGVSSSTVSAAYLGIMRMQPSASLVSQTVTQIQAGQTTLPAFESSLIASEPALYTTIPALVTIDAFYGATPSSATLTEVAASTTVTGFYTAIELHNLGYSDTNVWTVLASGWGADPTSSFYATYNVDATGTTAGYTAFINAAYAREFGFAPSAANLQNLLGDVPGTQALLNGGGHTASAIQVMAGLYGYLLEVGQTNDIGQYASATTAFLLAAANGTVTYGPELTQEFPSGTQASGGNVSITSTATSGAITVGIPGAAVLNAAGTALARPSDSANGTVSIVDEEVSPGSSVVPVNSATTVSGAIYYLGSGTDTFQFLPSNAGTLMLNPGGEAVVSGFDPTMDALDVGSLLSQANVNLNGDIAALGNYLTVVDQGADALLNFDPSGHGGGNTVAVLQGLGSSVTGLSSLVSQGAIKIG